MTFKIGLCVAFCASIATVTRCTALSTRDTELKDDTAASLAKAHEAMESPTDPAESASIPILEEEEDTPRPLASCSCDGTNYTINFDDGSTLRLNIEQMLRRQQEYEQLYGPPEREDVHEEVVSEEENARRLELDKFHEEQGTLHLLYPDIYEEGYQDAVDEDYEEEEEDEYEGPRDGYMDEDGNLQWQRREVQ